MNRLADSRSGTDMFSLALWDRPYGLMGRPPILRRQARYSGSVIMSRVVRLSASARRPRNEPGDARPQDAEISGCFEPMGAEGTVGIGSRRGVGHVGKALPALAGSLRGGRAGR